MATEVFNDFAASFKEGLTVLLVSLSFWSGFVEFSEILAVSGGFGFENFGFWRLWGWF